MDTRRTMLQGRNPAQYIYYILCRLRANNKSARYKIVPTTLQTTRTQLVGAALCRAFSLVLKRIYKSQFGVNVQFIRFANSYTGSVIITQETKL